MDKGFLFTPCSILIAISQVLIETHNGEHVWHVLICILGNWTLKCEEVNFLKFMSAGVPIRPLKNTHFNCSTCAMHAHDVHAHHDITRFTYDANHVTMMSPAFAFHSCHVGLRWHDIIGVHGWRNTTSSWFALHGDDVGMTSSCSHHIYIALMVSSCLEHNIIVTCMNHNFSHGV